MTKNIIKTLHNGDVCLSPYNTALFDTFTVLLTFKLLNQAQQASAPGFLVLPCPQMYVCVCVSTPEAINN